MHILQAQNSSTDINIWKRYDCFCLTLTAAVLLLFNRHKHIATCVLATMLRGDYANEPFFFCPTFAVEHFVVIRSKNSPTLCLCVFLLVWWSCQLPLAALQITKSSLTCWSLSQRRFMPCQTRRYQTATSRPWLRCVTWRTESWWWTSAGLNISQVGKLSNKHQACTHTDVQVHCLTYWSETGIRCRCCGCHLSPPTIQLANLSPITSWH